MLKRITTTFLFTLIFNFAFSQYSPKYYSLIYVADSAFQAHDYKLSMKTYIFAFKDNHGRSKVNDRYNAICAAAKAKFTDIAFSNLLTLANADAYDDYAHIYQDSDLISLHDDKRWNDVLNIIHKNEIKANRHINLSLKNELDTILHNDQKARNETDSIGLKFGKNSGEFKKIWKEIRINDSLNLIKVRRILDKYGWLGYDKVGKTGSLALFLVVQHSDLQTQIDYVPLMRVAVMKGKANGANLALLEDRIAIRSGKKQIYGSQVTSDKLTGKPRFYPIENEKEVDLRRLKVGLEPLRFYAKKFGMEYPNL